MRRRYAYVGDDLGLSTVAWEIILVAAVAAKVPPALDTFEGVILAVAGGVWKPAVELVEGQTVVVLPLAKVELWPLVHLRRHKILPMLASLVRGGKRAVTRGHATE